MASRAEDWCDVGTARRELRAEHADQAQVAGYIVQAVDWVGRVVDLPMLDRDRPIPKLCPPTSQTPILLDGVRWARPLSQVQAVKQWTTGEQRGRFPPAGEAEAITDPDAGTWVAGPRNPSVGRWVESAALKPDQRLLYPPAAGWPSGATWLEVTVREGLLPSEHPTLRAAVVNVVRWLWMGKTDGDVLALVDGLLAVYVPDGFLSVRARKER